MPDLFPAPQGSYAIVQGAQQGMVSVDLQNAGGTSLLGGEFPMLISSVAMSQSIKMAYFPTIGDSLYIYPLGNDVSKCQISGVALPSQACNFTGPSRGDPRQYNSAETVLKFYEENRASSFKRLQDPVSVVMPPVTIKGFIDGMTLQISSDAATFGWAKFTLTLTVIPPVRDS
jgi:hypothetical protein